MTELRGEAEDVTIRGGFSVRGSIFQGGVRTLKDTMDYNHIIKGNLNIVNNEKLRQLISKGPKDREPKQICFEEAREEIQTGINQLTERISNDKDIHKNHFSEWKSQ